MKMESESATMNDDTQKYFNTHDVVTKAALENIAICMFSEHNKVYT
jgi:hypothetical protein